MSPVQAYVKRLRKLNADELHAEGFEVAKVMREPLENGLNPLTPYRRMLLVSAELGRRDRTELSTGSRHLSTVQSAELQEISR